jgi:hypothetical protein
MIVVLSTRDATIIGLNERVKGVSEFALCSLLVVGALL